jgi:PAS domain S-box-containing protein
VRRAPVAADTSSPRGRPGVRRRAATVRIRIFARVARERGSVIIPQSPEHAVDSPFSLFHLPASASADELRGRLAALDTLIACAPVPIAVAHDPAGRYISANAALEQLLGVPAGSNVSMTPPGETPAYLITRDGEPIPPDQLPMQYAMRHRTHVRNNIEIVRRDGVVLFVQNDVEPLYDADGTVIGCVSVIVDFTARKRVEDLLREAGQRKDEFLATLSHELRNPLAPLRNALELMRRSPDDVSLMQRSREIMVRQLSQLVRLTDDLLDMSRISRNRVGLQRERVDLRTVLLAAIETTQPLIDAAGHWLEVALADEPLWVFADSTRLSQAFGNLLNNAAKYTDRGGQVWLRAALHDDRVVVTLTDTGIGIAPDLLPHIFDMFFRADETSERHGGLGIGLTLARRLIELHDGTIEVTSGSGGTTFVTSLPVAPADAVAAAPAARERQPGPSRRVLVAEDIPDAAEMLRLMLESMQHEVRVAADGVQAVAIARTFEPEVALLDLSMPRMDGFEAARQIRAALGDRVVLVALSGWGQDEDRRRAREAGFDTHLTKPADPEMLEELIASAVRGSIRGENLTEPS